MNAHDGWLNKEYVVIVEKVATGKVTLTAGN